jgi:hypothetical protein
MGCGTSKNAKANSVVPADQQRGAAAAAAAAAAAVVSEDPAADHPVFKIAPADVAVAFDRSPFLTKAFNRQGQKFVKTPDEVAMTLLAFDKVVFSPQSNITDSGRLFGMEYTFDRPASWAKREITGSEMNAIVQNLASASPEIAAKLSQDSPDLKQKQIDAYHQVRLGDLHEADVQKLQITTELIHPDATLQQYTSFKFEQLTAVLQNLNVGDSLTLDSCQATTLGGIPAMICRRDSVDEDGSGMVFVFAVPRPGQGLYVLATWMGLLGTDAGKRGLDTVNHVLATWQVKDLMKL